MKDEWWIAKTVVVIVALIGLMAIGLITGLTIEKRVERVVECQCRSGFRGNRIMKGIKPSFLQNKEETSSEE